MLALLEELIETGHRTLVFSQSRVMLDILQAAIAQRGWTFLRIDGTVVSATARAVRAPLSAAWYGLCPAFVSVIAPVSV